MKKAIATLLACMVMFSILVGCGATQSGSPSPAPSGSAPAEETVKRTLAISVPLTGNNTQYGISYRNGVQMAIEDFNAAGGIKGGEVKLEVYDDKGDQKEGINIANIIIEKPDVFAVIGSYGSNVSMAAGPVYQEAGMPMISPNTSHPDYPGLGDMMIPLACKSEVSFVEIGRILAERYPSSKMGIIYQNTDVGITTVDAVTVGFEGNGGTVCAAETFLPNQTDDFTPLLSAIDATDPDLLFIIAEYSDGASIALQANQLGMDAQLVGWGSMMKQQLLDLTAGKADGMLLIGISRIYTQEVMEASDYGDYTEDVAARYNAKYEEAFDQFSAVAYDAAMVAMVAADRVGTADTAALVAEMKKLDLDMAAGQAYFNEEGNLVREVVAFAIQDGKYALSE